MKHGNAETALALAVHGERVTWDISDHLLAVIADALHAANWQRGGGKGNKPKPITRPGNEEEQTSLGSAPIPASEFAAWWNEG